MNAIKCGKSHGYHASVADVRRCYNGEEVDLVNVGRTPGGADGATSKQVSYARDLLSKALSYQGTAVETVKPLEAYGRREITELISMLNGKRGGRISAEIMANFGLVFADGASLAPNKPADYTDPRARAPRFDAQTLEDGFYVRDGVVYKVIVAVHGSGRKYAKMLDHNGEWQMAQGAIGNLRPEHKMTLAQALETAHRHATNVESRLYGRCFICGRTLTREESIDRMMGPVCAGKFA
jgi:hypothetical protein